MLERGEGGVQLDILAEAEFDQGVAEQQVVLSRAGIVGAAPVGEAGFDLHRAGIDDTGGRALAGAVGAEILRPCGGG